MKNLIGALFLAFLFVGCDPGYSIYIHNNSQSPLYLKTHPAIESFYDSTSSRYYDSIVHYYEVKKENEYGIYKIAANQKFRVWGHIGIKPSLKELTLEYISLNNGTDSLLLDNKEKIMRSLKRVGKQRSFFIEIK